MDYTSYIFSISLYFMCMVHGQALLAHATQEGGYFNTALVVQSRFYDRRKDRPTQLLFVGRLPAARDGAKRYMAALRLAMPPNQLLYKDGFPDQVGE
ncbi:MAG: hypothetical protein ACYTF1_11935 [Planctomycetota bacterium]